MNQLFQIPDDHLEGLLEMEISPESSLKKIMPTRATARACNHDEILESIRLEPREYLLQNFSQHPGQLSAMKSIVKIMNGHEDAVLKVIDVVPQSLQKNRKITEQLERLNGRNHIADIQMHTRTASEILLKAGFVYPYIHDLMEGFPADFRDLMDKVQAHARSQKHHANMQDRMAARYFTETLMYTPLKTLREASPAIVES